LKFNIIFGFAVIGEEINLYTKSILAASCVSEACRNCVPEVCHLKCAREKNLLMKSILAANVPQLVATDLLQMYCKFAMVSIFWYKG
jgi:hypothetical protein